MVDVFRKVRGVFREMMDVIGALPDTDNALYTALEEENRAEVRFWFGGEEFPVWAKDLQSRLEAEGLRMVGEWCTVPPVGEDWVQMAVFEEQPMTEISLSLGADSHQGGVCGVLTVDGEVCDTYGADDVEASDIGDTKGLWLEALKFNASLPTRVGNFGQDWADGVIQVQGFSHGGSHVQDGIVVTWKVPATTREESRR